MPNRAAQPVELEKRNERGVSSSIYLESTTSEKLGVLPHEARQVKQVMASAVAVASPNTSLEEAASLMRKLDVPAIVVYDGPRLVGMISDRDLALRHGIREAPAGTTIERFMQVNIPACFEDDLLCDALARMQRSHLHWLPVLDSGRHLVGVLSRYVVPRQLQAPAAIW